MSLSPTSFLGWTSDVADLVRVPVTPIAHVGIMISSWVRPAVEPSDLPTDEQERNEFAIAERDLYRQMYSAQLLRATEFADQLRLLQSLPESALLNPRPPLIVPIDITGKRPSDIASIVELKLIRGASEKFRVGDIAVVGSDIVGRIFRIGMTRMELVPVTHKEVGLTRATIVPAHPTQNRPFILADIIMQSNGEAVMFAEVLATSGVQRGDLVQLDDSSWPAVGIGYTLGVVADVVQLDEAPLRHRVVIEPRRQARDLSKVIVFGSGENQTE